MRFHPSVSIAAMMVATSLTSGLSAYTTVTPPRSTASNTPTPTTPAPQPTAAPQSWTTAETSVEPTTPQPVVTVDLTPEPTDTGLLDLASAEPTPLEKVDDTYTKPALLEVAAARNVKVTKSWKKQQIIDAINAAIA